MMGCLFVSNDIAPQLSIPLRITAIISLFFYTRLGPDLWRKNAATLTTVAPAIGLPLIIILLADMERERWRQRKKRPQGPVNGDQLIFIRITAYMSALGAIGFLLSRNPYHAPQEYYCLNNTIPLRQSDGMSTCMAQAFLLFYSSMAIYATMLAH
jgi:hypothetical protein